MFRDSLTVIWATIILCICVAIIAVASFSVNAALYPAWLGVQRSAVESSKSYVDANNNALMTYKQEYAKLDTKISEAGDNSDSIGQYKAQQTAIKDAMCQQVASMKTGTINPLITDFLSQKGGC